MINKLIQIANELDKKGLRKEANYLDVVIKKIAEGSGQGSSSTARAQLAKRYSSSIYYAVQGDFDVAFGGTDEDKVMNILQSLKTSESQHPGIAEEVANLWAAKGEGTLYAMLKDEFVSTSNPFNDPEEWRPVDALLQELGITGS